MSGRTYTETERIGLMSAALTEGVPAIAKSAGIPESTLYQWFADSGGIVAIRSFAEAAKERALSDAKRAIYDEVVRRALKMDDEQILATFRAMLGGEAPAQPAVSVTNVQSHASQEYHIEPEALARALVTLKDADALPALPSGDGRGGS